jgi:hypothetical protein
MSAVVEDQRRQGLGRLRSGRRREILRVVLVLVALAAAGVVTGRLTVMVFDDPSPVAAPPAGDALAPGPRTVPSQGGPPSGRSWRRAAAVLHAWDADRAAAYARGDRAALRGLYAPGSRAGVRDLRVLQAYVERGLVVRGLRTQVLSLRVLTRSRNRLTLEVTDRLVGGRVVVGSARRDGGVGLPRDAPTTRVVVLRHQAGEWRVRSVQAA